MSVDGVSKWDAFRSQSRESVLQSELKPWMVRALQIIKFMIFVNAHILLMFGAALSKLVVILISTNLDSKVSYSKFHQKCFKTDVRRSAETVSAMMLSLWIIQNFPDVAAVVQSTWRVVSGHKTAKGISFLVVALECARAAGASLLIFCIFPSLEPTRCILLSVSALFIPFYQQIASAIHRSFDPNSSMMHRLSVLISSIPRSLLFLTVVSSCYLWVILDVPFTRYILLPIALILSAIGFWDAWIGLSHAASGYHYLYQLKYGIRKMSASTRLVLSIGRIAISTIIFFYALFVKELGEKDLRKSLGPSSKSSSLYSLALWMVVVNFLLRLSARFLAAMGMRVMPIFHPLLAVPTFLLLLVNAVCYAMPSCWIASVLARVSLQWQCYHWKESILPFSDVYISVVWLLAYLFWVRHHVRAPAFEHSDDVIDSMSPVVCGLFIEQSLVIYHNSVCKKGAEDDAAEGDNERECGELRITNDEIDKTVTLYVCATMWHETRTEMMQMIKSILGLDREHCVMLSGKTNQNHINFRLEAHIFFDDAWEDQKECGRSPNQFFRSLFNLLLELTENETEDCSLPNTRVLVNTPYGGRLVFRMPGGTLLFVHLKDKKLIRHKKRWSQVMYMYYLLGHRIMDSHMSIEDRQLEADNTYILAIDGDSKFQPSAVLKLLYLMNVKTEIGCACGRIHPIGNGVMVWYQKFEYAIAHWFQKAAEHVFGCVLCAPGCFSLFRASALMDDNVMHKYTKTACEPRHFVQYDQGEDRWLSTLLLKQGYRIEYAAAADAETYAPEGFNEFFNQRRRWTPSSVANTIDLLADYKRVCANNESISKLYIMYQVIVIGFSLVGPAIMFTMLVYAQVAAFEVAATRMMLYNSVPVMIFVFICFVGTSKHQLLYARMASVAYAFIMLAVVVATANQIILETVFSPTSMFVLTMVFIFSIAAFIHPQEFFNIIYGLVFFLMIPCTYVFLSLYSLINLNVINWGTREAVSKAVGEDTEAESFFGGISRRLGLQNCVSAIASLKKKTPAVSEDLTELKSRMEALESELSNVKNEEASRSPLGKLNILSTPAAKEPEFEEMTPISTDGKKDGKAMESRFMWMDAEYLQVCSRGRLNASEDNFWNELVDQYLKPIETTKEKTKREAEELVSLRNSIASSILIMNGLLVLAIFLIQKHKEILSFQYKPYDGFQWMKLSEKTGKFEKTGEPLKIEPLGLVIIIFLMGILIVQTIGMFIHRLNTLVGAFHEVSNMEDFVFYKPGKGDEDKILENARQMFDRAYYDHSHGADGYTRVLGDSQSTANVLYKLQRTHLTKRFQRNGAPRQVLF